VCVCVSLPLRDRDIGHHVYNLTSKNPNSPPPLWKKNKKQKTKNPNQNTERGMCV
jgi:hypothetical protein